MGQSPTLGHPAPQVRMERQFKGLASFGYSLACVKIGRGSTPYITKQSTRKFIEGGLTSAPMTFSFLLVD